MKRLIYIFFAVLLLAGCRSSKPEAIISIDWQRLDSITALIKELRTENVQLEQEKTAIIDTLRRMKLPEEKSVNVIPANQRSFMTTTLAYSTAWVDSIGLLHHTIANKDSADMPYRKETKDKVKDNSSVTNSSVSTTTKVTDQKNKSEKETIPVKVYVERFGGKFFYTSGWVLWIGIVIGSVWFMQTRTQLKPITRIINFITKLFKK